MKTFVYAYGTKVYFGEGQGRDFLAQALLNTEQM